MALVVKASRDSNQIAQLTIGPGVLPWLECLIGLPKPDNIASTVEAGAREPNLDEVNVSKVGRKTLPESASTLTPLEAQVKVFGSRLLEIGSSGTVTYSNLRTAGISAGLINRKTQKWGQLVSLAENSGFIARKEAGEPDEVAQRTFKLINLPDNRGTGSAE